MEEGQPQLTETLITVRRNTMIRAFFLSIEQFSDRRVLAVLAKSALLSLLLCVVFAFAFSKALVWGIEEYYDVSALSAFVTGILTILIVFFAFRAVAIPIVGFFADEIVGAVEARHYPHAAGRARVVGFGQSMRLAILSVLRLIGVNLLMLPVYIFLAFTIIGAPIAFFIVNAVLVGRDMGEMVAIRHLEPRHVKGWLGHSRFGRAILGGITTVFYTLPLLNLVATVMGAAMATHLFHQGKGSL